MMKAVMDARELRRLIAATRDFRGRAGSRPERDHIRLQFHKDGCCVEAAAVDGYTLSTEWAVCDSVDEDFVVLIRTTLPPIGRKNGELAVVDRLEDGRTSVRIGDMQFAYSVPDAEKFFDVQKAIPHNAPEFRIGVNGSYLLKALKAASTTENLNRRIELRFHGELGPIVIQTRASGLDSKCKNIKLVLPVRLRGEENE